MILDQTAAQNVSLLLKTVAPYITIDLIKQPSVEEVTRAFMGSKANTYVIRQEDRDIRLRASQFIGLTDYLAGRSNILATVHEGETFRDFFAFAKYVFSNFHVKLGDLSVYSKGGSLVVVSEIGESLLWLD